MIGDKLIIKPYHLPPAKEILSYLERRAVKGQKFVISISGESGSGKSTLSMALKQVAEEAGIPTFVFHMDDYFFLPPTSNHEQRQESLDYVGPHEVDLDLLESHVNQAKQGSNDLNKPIIHYRENSIRTELADLSETKLIIVEGTYCSLLPSCDVKAFLTRNYIDTREDRLARNRDVLDEYGEEILEIEHQIISSHASTADLLIDSEYKIIFA